MAGIGRISKIAYTTDMQPVLHEPSRQQIEGAFNNLARNGGKMELRYIYEPTENILFVAPAQDYLHPQMRDKVGIPHEKGVSGGFIYPQNLEEMKAKHIQPKDWVRAKNGYRGSTHAAGAVQETEYGRVYINPSRDQLKGLYAQKKIPGGMRILKHKGNFYCWDARADWAIHARMYNELGLYDTAGCVVVSPGDIVNNGFDIAKAFASQDGGVVCDSKGERTDNPHLDKLLRATLKKAMGRHDGITKNPSDASVAGLMNRIRYKSLRYLMYGNDVFVMDAYNDTYHGEMADAEGLREEWEGDKCYTGTVNDRDLPSIKRDGGFKKWIQKRHKQLGKMYLEEGEGENPTFASKKADLKENIEPCVNEETADPEPIEVSPGKEVIPYPGEIEAIAVRRISKVAAYGNGIIKNPQYGVVAKQVKDARYNNLRYLEYAGEIFVVDAANLEHGELADEVGLTDQWPLSGANMPFNLRGDYTLSGYIYASDLPAIKSVGLRNWIDERHHRANRLYITDREQLKKEQANAAELLRILTQGSKVAYGDKPLIDPSLKTLEAMLQRSGRPSLRYIIWGGHRYYTTGDKTHQDLADQIGIPWEKQTKEGLSGFIESGDIQGLLSKKTTYDGLARWEKENALEGAVLEDAEDRRKKAHVAMIDLETTETWENPSKQQLQGILNAMKRAGADPGYQQLEFRYVIHSDGMGHRGVTYGIASNTKHDDLLQASGTAKARWPYCFGGMLDEKKLQSCSNTEALREYEKTHSMMRGRYTSDRAAARGTRLSRREPEHVEDVSRGGYPKRPVYINPGPTRLRGLEHILDRSGGEYGSPAVRMLKADGNVYVWDAASLTHEQMYHVLCLEHGAETSSAFATDFQTVGYGLQALFDKRNYGVKIGKDGAASAWRDLSGIAHKAAEEVQWVEDQHPRDETGKFTDGDGATKTEVPEHLKQIPSMMDAIKRGNWSFKEKKVRDGYGQKVTEYEISPNDVPENWGTFKRNSGTEVRFNPELAEIYDDEGYKIVRLKQDAKNDIPEKAEEGIIYRGMSWEEYQNALKSGSFSSTGDYNIGEDQKGLTYFSSDPKQSEAYANGFAPWQFKATPSKPAVVVAIHDPGNHKVDPRQPTELGLAGEVPISAISHVFVGNAAIVTPGSVDVIEDKYAGAKSQEGSRSSPSTSVVWSREEVPKKDPLKGAKIAHSWEPTEEDSAALKAQLAAAPTYVELDAKTEAKRFNDLISDAKASSPYGAAVTVYPTEDYAEKRLFVTPDGLCGFALSGDDIVSVFRHKKSKMWKVVPSMLRLAVKQGGRRLDCFDTALPSIYGECGFKAVSRTPFNPEFAPPDWDRKVFQNFNGGMPDVVFMVYDPKHGPYKFGDGEPVNDYDLGMEVQKRSVIARRSLAAEIQWVEDEHPRDPETGQFTDGEGGAVPGHTPITDPDSWNIDKTKFKDQWPDDYKVDSFEFWDKVEELEKQGGDSEWQAHMFAALEEEYERKKLWTEEDYKRREDVAYKKFTDEHWTDDAIWKRDEWARIKAELKSEYEKHRDPEREEREKKEQKVRAMKALGWEDPDDCLLSLPQQKEKAALTAAKFLGYPDEMVHFRYDLHSCQVGDKKFNAAGLAYIKPSATAEFDVGHIALYPDQIDSRASVWGVMAHEIEHQKFQTVLNALEAEKKKLFEDPEVKAFHSWAGEVGMRADGSLMPPLDKKYPLYTRFHKYDAANNELISKDGVTDYSESYWTAYKNMRQVTLDSAYHETVAEIAKLHHQYGDNLWEMKKDQIADSTRKLMLGNIADAKKALDEARKMKDPKEVEAGVRWLSEAEDYYKLRLRMEKEPRVAPIWKGYFKAIEKTYFELDPYRKMHQLKKQEKKSDAERLGVPPELRGEK